MRSKDLSQIISISLALISLLVCLFLWGQLSGFEKGYFYGMFKDVPQTRFSGVGETNYFHAMNFWYLIIAVGFFVYVIGSYLKPLFISSIVCILSLSIVIYPFWDMLEYKNEVLTISSHYRNDSWLNISIYFDWFLLLAAIILMFIQFTRMINNSRTEIKAINIG